MNIREASRDDAEGIATVHVDSWKTTYKGIISEAVLSNLSVEKRKNSWLWTFDNLNTDEKLFVAEKTDGKIVGFSNGGRRRDEGFQQDGELYALYLSKDYQRLGIGKLLFHAVVESLNHNGYTSMMVWVLSENPSVGFYQALGGHIIGQKDITIGEDSLVETALGWDSLGSLLEKWVLQDSNP